MATVEADTVVGRFPALGTGRAARALTSTPFLGAAVAILVWPIASIVPSIGPDASWMAGIYMAHGEGLQFGRDIVFTYGPLGFLEVPALYSEAMWIVAFLYQALIHVALAISLIWVARRAVPLALAVAACYCLLVIGRLEGAAVLLAFIWCFVALGERPPRFALPLVAFGGGTLAAVELLGKANYGIAILAFATLAVFGARGRRPNLPVFAAVASCAFVACWLAAGQGFAELPAFALRSLQLISGYSSAMGTDVLTAGWELSAAIAAMALLLAAAALGTWRDPPSRRIASLALVALFSFVTFKQGFVRQGVPNTPEFFALILGATIAVAHRLAVAAPLPPVVRRPLAVVLAGALAALALAVLPTPSIWQSLQPRVHVEAMRAELDALLSRGKREQLASEARRSMRAAYGIDPRILSTLGDRPVHIDPWEAGVAWAYDLNWHPLPVMQSYVAYTQSLDALNAAALGASNGPAAILRHSTTAFGGGVEGSIDDRYPGWESPAAMRAMLCNFQAVRTGPRWQLLERAGNRCGPPRALGVVRSVTGEAIRIPSPPGPRDIVFARIGGIGVEGAEALRTLLYRAPDRTATLGDGRTWRLVPGTAGDGLILRASRRVDYPRPFRLAPDTRSISLAVAGSGRRPVSIEFFAQRVGRFPHAGGGAGRDLPAAQSDAIPRR